MSTMVFSLDSEHAALEADRQLLRDGVNPRQIHHIDRFSYLPAANDPDITYVETSMPPELERELAKGRVLLEVEVLDDNLAAVQRLLSGLGQGVRTFLTGA